MEISRNLLAGALGALGKLVSRTSPVEAYRSVLIEGKENKISFRTAGNEESITFTVDCPDVTPLPVYAGTLELEEGTLALSTGAVTARQAPATNPQ